MKTLFSKLEYLSLKLDLEMEALEVVDSHQLMGSK